MRLRFGECVLDPAGRELMVSGAPVHLAPKGFELLDLLLASRPRAVSKKEIHDRLWPDSIVTEGTLTSLVAELRAALGDDPKTCRYIRTVHRHGYAFCSAVEEVRGEGRARRPGLACRLIWGTREMALPRGETVVGRDPACDVFIDHPSVSRRHACLTVGESEVVLQDLGSKNGTFRKGLKISSPCRLSDQDEVQIGSVPLKVCLLRGPGTTLTEG
jgi:DNA-binding winged helix-turn-helix (wHTH) protein